jgi:hypothetical protein
VLEEGATKFAFNSSLFITLLPIIFKLGARNVFHWLADTSHEHIHSTKEYIFTHYIQNGPEMCSNGLQMHLMNMFIARVSSPGETEDTTS